MGELKIDTSYRKLQVRFCPKCHTQSTVENSRTDDCGVVRRVRMCPKCRITWKTVEVIEDERSNRKG